MQCPRCQYPRMKRWNELNDDEKFIVERLPLSAKLSLEKRKKHLFCPRCQHEETSERSEIC